MHGSKATLNLGFNWRRLVC